MYIYTYIYIYFFLVFTSVIHLPSLPLDFFVVVIIVVTFMALVILHILDTFVFTGIKKKIEIFKRLLLSESKPPP